MGHILGPFDEPPFENIVYSPINLVLKPNKKHCLIMDLSYPFRSDQSVNSCIPEENTTVQYHHIDEVIEMGIALGKNLWVAQIDLEMAFRNQPMSFSQLPLFSFFPQW